MSILTPHPASLSPRPPERIDTSIKALTLDLGLLLLRSWLGLSMLLIHGVAKLQSFGPTVATFHDKMGIPTPLAVVAVFAESFGSLMIVAGFATRLAALVMMVQMSVAFTLVHHLILAQGNPQSGELAFIYLGGFATLLLTGGGRFSVDTKLFK